jgi:hypothetical protein
VEGSLQGIYRRGGGSTKKSGGGGSTEEVEVFYEKMTCRVFAGGMQGFYRTGASFAEYVQMVLQNRCG